MFVQNILWPIGPGSCTYRVTGQYEYAIIVILRLLVPGDSNLQLTRILYIIVVQFQSKSVSIDSKLRITQAVRFVSISLCASQEQLGKESVHHAGRQEVRVSRSQVTK